MAKVKAEPLPPPPLAMPLEDAIARIQRCGYEVVRATSTKFRVNLPDPVDRNNIRSYFTEARLTEIALLDEAGITDAVNSAPEQSRPVFRGRWPKLSQPTEEAADMRKKTGPILKPKDQKGSKGGGAKKKTVAASSSKTKNTKPAAGAQPSRLARMMHGATTSVTTDAEARALIKKAEAAGISQKPSTLARWMRSQGKAMSGNRMAKLLQQK